MKYLDLLRSLCACGDKAIRSNQVMISKLVFDRAVDQLLISIELVGPDVIINLPANCPTGVLGATGMLPRRMRMADFVNQSHRSIYEWVTGPVVLHARVTCTSVITRVFACAFSRVHLLLQLLCGLRLPVLLPVLESPQVLNQPRGTLLPTERRYAAADRQFAVAAGPCAVPESLRSCWCPQPMPLCVDVLCPPRLYPEIVASTAFVQRCAPCWTQRTWIATLTSCWSCPS